MLNHKYRELLILNDRVFVINPCVNGSIPFKGDGALMIKIVVTGERGSGVTSYFYGMMLKMMRGAAGVHLRINDADVYSKLHDGLSRLRDVGRPGGERWSSPCESPVACEMDVLYEFREFDTVRWTEYMPERFYDECDQLPHNINCLFVCIDGSLLQSDEDSLKEVADDFYNRFGADLCNALLHAEAKRINTIAPVCILITKYDEVSSELQDMSIIAKFVERCLPILFQKDGNTNRIVAVCPVSLGKNIDDGGKLRPKNVEKPIFFALLPMLVALQREIERTYEEIIIKNRKHKELTDRLFSVRLAAIWPPKPDHTEELKRELKRMLTIIQALKNKLLLENQDIPLFINGKEQNWKDYFV